MKRDFLKEQGLNDEQIEAVMKAHGSDVQNFREQVSTLETEKNSLNEQITNRDKDIKGLKKNNSDNEELSNQLKDLQDKYKTDTDKLSKQLSNVKLDNAVSKSLSSTNARNPEVVKKMLNMDSVELNEDGSVKGLDEQIKGLQESDAYLFDGGQLSNYQAKTGDVNNDTNEVDQMASIFNPNLNDK
ncbi:hypothetical protein GSH19_05270 [Lactobacillus sp. S2-2]|uniref:phage scaffolding protein n=1 Tax=Lactobacillus sp. S2-2 TaxID=2692917 RepID=UPI001F344852|nr:phage scaffolding protein [Lactobacillus sp. S2-2]MCF6515563.1 hypothetical protein [Lactobacillus sp. S2-2]